MTIDSISEHPRNEKDCQHCKSPLGEVFEKMDKKFVICLFCRDTLETVEDENSRWRGNEEGEHYHHCLRDRRSST